MAKAYQCDRCDRFEPGEPEGMAKGGLADDAGEFQRGDLCRRCAASYLDWWDNPETDADESEAVDEDLVECEVCGDTFNNEAGKNIHAGRVHQDEPDEDDEPEPEPEPEPEDTSSPDSGPTLPEGITANDVELLAQDKHTIYEVAQALDVSRSEASGIMRRLDLLDYMGKPKPRSEAQR